jgi:hypothetical protein
MGTYSNQQPQTKTLPQVAKSQLGIRLAGQQAYNKDKTMIQGQT